MIVSTVATLPNKVLQADGREGRCAPSPARP